MARVELVPFPVIRCRLFVIDRCGDEAGRMPALRFLFHDYGEVLALPAAFLGPIEAEDDFDAWGQ